jgi:hypothetical protein
MAIHRAAVMEMQERQRNNDSNLIEERFGLHG